VLDPQALRTLAANGIDVEKPAATDDGFAHPSTLSLTLNSSGRRSGNLSDLTSARSSPVWPLS
jgi:hypothetical protein